MIKAAKVLTAKGRKQIKAKNFALPGGRYPINDPVHARNALARVSQFGSPGEKAAVRAKVHKKYPGIGKEAGVSDVTVAAFYAEMEKIAGPISFFGRLLGRGMRGGAEAAALGGRAAGRLAEVGIGAEHAIQRGFQGAVAAPGRALRSGRLGVVEGRTGVTLSPEARRTLLQDRSALDKLFRTPGAPVQGTLPIVPGQARAVAPGAFVPTPVGTQRTMLQRANFSRIQEAGPVAGRPAPIDTRVVAAPPASSVPAGGVPMTATPAPPVQAPAVAAPARAPAPPVAPPPAAAGGPGPKVHPDVAAAAEAEAAAAAKAQRAAAAQQAAAQPGVEGATDTVVQEPWFQRHFGFQKGEKGMFGGESAKAWFNKLKPDQQRNLMAAIGGGALVGGLGAGAVGHHVMSK